MSHWYRDGEPTGGIAPDDRGLQYGDGLFETIAIRGGKPRLWAMHMDRLARGCRRLAIGVPETHRLQEELLGAVQQADVDRERCVAKILVTAGAGARGYARPDVARGAVTIGVFGARVLDQVAYRDGVETIICKTRLATPSATAGLKTLNRLEQVLSAREWQDTGIFEGLNLDADGRLICGTMSNVFIVTDQRIITPALDRCGVEGVMRRLLLETLPQAGFDLDIRDLDVTALEDAEEVFLSNSQFGILPVARCGKLTWNRFDVARRAMRQIAALGIEECAA